MLAARWASHGFACHGYRTQPTGPTLGPVASGRADRPCGENERTERVATRAARRKSRPHRVRCARTPEFRNSEIVDRRPRARGRFALPTRRSPSTPARRLGGCLAVEHSGARSLWAGTGGRPPRGTRGCAPRTRGSSSNGEKSDATRIRTIIRARLATRVQELLPRTSQAHSLLSAKSARWSS